MMAPPPRDTDPEASAARPASEPEEADDDRGVPLNEHGLPTTLRPAFPHPEWTVGVVLVIAVVMLLLGVLGNPVWLLIGSPFIITLAVWVTVKVVERRRRRRGPPR